MDACGDEPGFLVGFCVEGDGGADGAAVDWRFLGSCRFQLGFLAFGLVRQRHRRSRINRPLHLVPRRNPSPEIRQRRIPKAPSILSNQNFRVSALNDAVESGPADGEWAEVEDRGWEVGGGGRVGDEGECYFLEDFDAEGSVGGGIP